MATEKQMDELVEAVNDIACQISDIAGPFDRDDVNNIVDSLCRIADALDRIKPPPPPIPKTPANNYWVRRQWEEEHGRAWTPEDSESAGE